ncbi:uncharacterized protein CLUP02_11540 [Colletotrichum lupini]|uniref:Uncharacterized protein n=1 Tax=Colletotrichum lupini TaxID=145971 RepID=A0A9Q8SYS4_9PEZI|nr:uncharacterized protein CLUP02_11540 [Colletotrichum lupini]UQC86041.1 hypothetical protein CLUP02_11540 [Colletotrichum lupini]
MKLLPLPLSSIVKVFLHFVRFDPGALVGFSIYFSFADCRLLFGAEPSDSQLNRPGCWRSGIPTPPRTGVAHQHTCFAMDAMDTESVQSGRTQDKASRIAKVCETLRSKDVQRQTLTRGNKGLSPMPIEEDQMRWKDSIMYTLRQSQSGVRVPASTEAPWAWSKVRSSRSLLTYMTLGFLN